MIFTSTFSRVDSKPSIPPVSKQSATEKEKQGKQSRESATEWSILQAIPLPEDRLKKVNEYLLSRVPTDPKKEKNPVEKSYSDNKPRTGIFLNVLA